ncbi:thioredoxin-disulfide reductase [Candidatus Nomurabacteria bacterium]|uniref:Thioredoxin reductase n=1 Tax=Candidatus Dojkabacteria bacterium TaxID=2099670 RepID=A0A955I5A6_9BACT|nr:thioredoxin-disulfide reductase [Candidatus Dojkabacteria bacterium]MCB9789517.1 thioredoxin-disulfide reductase [Candidatus Nomurabacteria bacterium]
MVKKDVIIIGSGPAGLTAAIYSARARLDTLVIAGQEYGGQLMNTTLVENFPGFPQGVMGPELMMNMLKQAENQGAEFLYKYSEKVDLSSPVKSVVVEGETYEAPVVIIAVGSSPRRLGVPGEDTFYGKGVSTCATCDAAFYREKVVAVIGGGDSAAEEATFLTKFAKKVYLIHRRDELRASKAMQERVLSNEKIEVLWNTEVREIVGDQTVKKLNLYNNADKSEKKLDVDGMFLAIGHDPNSGSLSADIQLDERGFISVKEGTKTETNIEGVFVCGDVHDSKYEQAITAAGMGCMAAMDAEKWLSSRK